MKKLIFILVCFGFVVSLSGQELEFFGSYSVSNYNKFQNDVGYGLGYYPKIKSKNKLGFCLQHSFYYMNYSEVYPSSEDGISTYIMDIEAENQRIVFKTSYAFMIVNNPKSSLYIGPEIGINYFFINEQIVRHENNLITAANYKSKYSGNAKFGFGFLIEFGLKEVLFKRVSVSSSVHPEIIIYTRKRMEGGHNPQFIGLLNFNLGVKYRLKKD
jgi:hypothetical protein